MTRIIDIWLRLLQLLAAAYGKEMLQVLLYTCEEKP